MNTKSTNVATPGNSLRLSRSVVVTAAVMGCLLWPAAVMAGDWQKLGSRSVALIGDHDVIPVTVLRGNFRKIKLKVRENDINMNDLTVIYATGAADNMPIRGFIKKGGESRVIDLRGGDRIIRSVQLTYRSVLNSKGRAEVAVWGKD
jgi:hypothetical protein